MSVTAPTALDPAGLNAALLAAHSATRVLERLYGGPVLIRRLAPDAIEVGGAGSAALDLQRGETVTLRRVQLVSRGRTLSEAELRYVATRLPAGLAQCLLATDRPFGQVVHGLGLRRITLSARLGKAGERDALVHHAVLAWPGGGPVAVVHERYPWPLFG